MYREEHVVLVLAFSFLVQKAHSCWLPPGWAGPGCQASRQQPRLVLAFFHEMHVRSESPSRGSEMMGKSTGNLQENHGKPWKSTGKPWKPLKLQVKTRLSNVFTDSFMSSWGSTRAQKQLSEALFWSVVLKIAPGLSRSETVLQSNR